MFDWKRKTEEAKYTDTISTTSRWLKTFGENGASCVIFNIDTHAVYSGARSSERSTDSGGVNNPHLLREHATFLCVPSLSRSLHRSAGAQKTNRGACAIPIPEPESVPRRARQRAKKQKKQMLAPHEESLEVTHLQDLSSPKMEKKDQP